MIGWRDAAAQLQLSPAAAELAAEIFARVAQRHDQQFGGGDARAWWVPGRIEVLGKHTDYGGGRSLLCAVERGFHVVATPRTDRRIHLLDALSGASTEIAVAADTPHQPGHWSDYVVSVARRIARDFPSASRGMNLVLESSLPPASGLSSSSALVIACFLPMAQFNDLADTASWRRNLARGDALAEYLGAVENGRAFADFAADHGVGTQGGGEDHVAILGSRRGELAQYHFLPATRETAVALDPAWEFVIGMSGVHAAKGGRVQAQYNALSQQLATMLALWQRGTGRHDGSLFAALQSSPDAGARLEGLIADAATGNPISLLHRLQQFRAETEEIIPAVVALLRQGALNRIGELVERSQDYAERVLQNQLPETQFLARRAPEIGAAAASAFGAGFGGSVWALVPVDRSESFCAQWTADYAAAFPERRARARFFRSRAGPPAYEICR